MAKKESVSSKSIETLRKKRPGIHSKKKNSVHKQVKTTLKHTLVKEDNEKIRIKTNHQRRST
jgi:hypothetical protein